MSKRGNLNNAYANHMAGAPGAGTLSERAVGLRAKDSVDASEISALIGARLREAAGITLTELTRRKDAALQLFHVIVPAERSWPPGVTHPGERWIYVLRGVVTVVHADRADTLHAGDSIHLNAREPHRLMAAAEAELIVVAGSRS